MRLASFPQISLVALLLAALPACGQSPLFHHVHNETTVTPAGEAPTAETPKVDAPGAPSPAPTTCEIPLPKTDLCASLTWIEKSVPRKKEGAFELQFRRRGSSELVDPPGSVAVVLWMPDMDHGSSPVTVERKAVGVYSATRVYFVMGGDWDILVQLLSGEEIIDQGTYKIRF